MLEHDRPATADVVKHIDRCLSCLSCMTTCPSGVHFMHLIDHARVHVEETFSRPLLDRWLRTGLAWVLPRNGVFRAALAAARLARPMAGALDRMGLAPLAAMLRLAPERLPPRGASGRLFPAAGERRGRVALLDGCVGPVLAPSIHAAAVRLLTRQGIEVVVTAAGCCGSLTHHLGREKAALAAARRQIDAWTREIDGAGLDAILVTASGCGTTIKDYGFMLRTDPAYSGKAARVSRLALDISEYLTRIALVPTRDVGALVVAYHGACSLQHGQKIGRAPKELLSRIGFVVKDVPEGHLCCGSAGTYNILQPQLARRLRERKVGNIEKLRPDAIAAANIGCMTQIATGTPIPVVHTVELVDWATGGPAPDALSGRGATAVASKAVAGVM
jgi:glycolate oxidase iron-sulfur subunit